MPPLVPVRLLRDVEGHVAGAIAGFERADAAWLVSQGYAEWLPPPNEPPPELAEGEGTPGSRSPGVEVEARGLEGPPAHAAIRRPRVRK